MARHLELCAEWIGQLSQQQPALLDWVERMRERDGRFRAAYDQTTGGNGVVVLHILHHLSRHPELWRDVQPGAGRPWAELLHPLGRLW